MTLRGLFATFALALAGCPTEIIIVDDGGAPGGDDAGAGADGGPAVDAGEVVDAGPCDDGQTVFGVIVILTEGNTEVRVCNATVTIDDGSAAGPETLGISGGTTPGSACRYFGAEDRGGTFDVVANAPGWATKTFADLVVPVDGCGRPPQAQTITLRMEPAAADAGSGGDGGI